MQLVNFMIITSCAPDTENAEDRRPSPIAEFKGSCVTEAGISWTQYHGYDTHVKYMECLSSKYSGQVSLLTIGTSSEGRSLKLIKIGDRFGGVKKAIWIDCGIHARCIIYIEKDISVNLP